MFWKQHTVVRGAVVIFGIVLAAWMLAACAPWYRAYDLVSDEDLTKISAIPQLRKALKDSEPNVRMEAAMALGGIGPDARGALPDLVDVLGDNRYEVREASATAMERIIGTASVSETDKDLMVLVHISRLESEDWPARVDAANQLGQMGPAGADAVPALSSALLDETEWSYYWSQQYNGVRGAAAKALGEMRFAARAANPALIKASQFQDPGVRVEAVSALGKIGTTSDSTVIEALKASLKDSDSGVRREAANALGGFEVYADGTVPNLVKALSDPDVDARMEAAQVLGRLGPKTDSAVKALVAALNDVDAGVRKEAATALGNVHPDDQGKVLPAVRLKLDDTDKEVRQAAARTIAGFRVDSETTAVEPRMPPVVSPAPETAAEPVVMTKSTAKIRSTVDVLNIRAVPDLTGRRVGKLFLNETAVLLDTQGEWVKIKKADGTTGYVSREYTAIVPETDGAFGPLTTETAAVQAAAGMSVAPVAASLPAAMVRPTVDVLNIRAVPDLNGRRVGKLFPNETAVLLDTQGDWVKIKKADGTTGYVFKEYTTIVPETGGASRVLEPEPQAAQAAASMPTTPVVAAPAAVVGTPTVPTVPKIRPTVDVLIIRAEPYGNEQIGQLMRNEAAEVVETLAGWIKIKKADGTTGYVIKEYTETVPEAGNAVHSEG